MSSQYVLLQFGSDPFNARYEDLEGRSAFTLALASQTPTLVIKMTREAVWSQQHPGIHGPDNSYFYFGPATAPGYVMYGNNGIDIPMSHLRRQHRNGSTSRYFTAQSGRNIKWRIEPTRMECLDGRTVLAVWEISQPEDEYNARLTIKQPGLPLVTELLTTLILNRMAQDLGW